MSGFDQLRPYGIRCCYAEKVGDPLLLARKISFQIVVVDKEQIGSPPFGPERSAWEMVFAGEDQFQVGLAAAAGGGGKWSDSVARSFLATRV